MKRTVRTGEFTLTMEGPDDEGVRMTAPSMQVTPQDAAAFERMVQAAGGDAAIAYVGVTEVYFGSVDQDGADAGWGVVVQAPGEMKPKPVEETPFGKLMKDRRAEAEQAREQVERGEKASA